MPCLAREVPPRPGILFLFWMGRHRPSLNYVVGRGSCGVSQVPLCSIKHVTREVHRSFLKPDFIRDFVSTPSVCFLWQWRVSFESAQGSDEISCRWPGGAKAVLTPKVDVAPAHHDGV